MLGFSVRVERVVSDEESVLLASWTADGTALWDNLVTLGRGQMVLYRGGYPDRYQVVVSEVLHVFDSAIRDKLPDVLELKPRWELTVKDDDIGVCPSDVVLTIEAWDES